MGSKRRNGANRHEQREPTIARTYRHCRQDSTDDADQATLARVTELRQRGEKILASIRALLQCGADDGFLADELKRLRDELEMIDQDTAEIEARPDYTEPIELDRVRESLQKIDPLWDMLVPDEQKRVLQLLIETITVSTTGLDIRFRPNGIEEIVRELQPIEERTRA